MIADFSAQRACTRKSHMTLNRHDDGFQHPACLCCIFLKFFYDDDWVVLEKCCIIWAEIFPDAINTLQSRLIFVGISFIFWRFDAASFSPDTLLPLASFSFWAVLIQHHPLERKQAPIFVCLHGAGPICKKIKGVHWGGQANEKRRPGGRPKKHLYIKKYIPAELLLWLYVTV